MTKVSEESLESAAQCWCDEDTSSIEMDSRLAIAFAKRLDAKEKYIAQLRKDINFMQSCINGGESATKTDRPSQRLKEQG